MIVMIDILEKVEELLPKKAVDKAELEGSEVVVYTKDKEFFRKCDSTVRAAVEEMKKRIEVRGDSSILSDKGWTEKFIYDNVQEEAGLKAVYFEPERSLVIIVAQKPGIVIGKGGELFKKIRSETLWMPRIERVPSINSDVVNGIRKMMHTETKFRKDFLNNV